MSDKDAGPPLIQERRVDLPHEFHLRLTIQRRSLGQTISSGQSIHNVHTASSKNTIGGSLSSTLAIASLCFSPPEIMRPRSPTVVLYPSGSLSTACATFALRATSFTSSSLASSRPYRMLCKTSAWKSGVSCGTTPICRRRLCNCTWVMSWSSMEMVPDCGA